MTGGLIWVRHIALITGCGLLGGWLWTVLAPQSPVNGGILSAAGVLAGVASGCVISVVWTLLRG